MPQMSPMLWSMLFIYFLMIFIIFNVLNYFNFIPSILNLTKPSIKHLNKTPLNWKW